MEWLGEVPVQWEVKRLKHVSVVENSGAYGSEPGEGAIDLPVCTTAHLTVDGLFLMDDMPVRGFSVTEANRYVGAPGDIFVVKSSGSNTNIISGKLGLVTNATPRIVFSNFLLRIRPSARPYILSFLLFCCAVTLPVREFVEWWLPQHIPTSTCRSTLEVRW